jgi:hypothetical protein
MAIIDSLFSILDCRECNRLAPVGLWRMAYRGYGSVRMVQLYAIGYQPYAIVGSHSKKRRLGWQTKSG